MEWGLGSNIFCRASLCESIEHRSLASTTCGKGIEKRGEEGQIYKHLPDADYVQNADQWLVTTGAIQAARIRPAEELKCTNRQFLNDVPTGIAAPAVMEKSENRTKNTF